MKIWTVFCVDSQCTIAMKHMENLHRSHYIRHRRAPSNWMAEHAQTSKRIKEFAAHDFQWIFLLSLVLNSFTLATGIVSVTSHLLHIPMPIPFVPVRWECTHSFTFQRWNFVMKKKSYSSKMIEFGARNSIISYHLYVSVFFKGIRLENIYFYVKINLCFLFSFIEWSNVKNWKRINRPNIFVNSERKSPMKIIHINNFNPVHNLCKMIAFASTDPIVYMVRLLSHCNEMVELRKKRSVCV